MLPGLGFAEIMVLVIVALIVVGPRGMPRMVRQISGFLRSLRAMASEFQQSFEEMGREAELDELRKEIEALKRLEPVDDVRRDMARIDREMAELTDTPDHPRLRAYPKPSPDKPGSKPE